jgi:hypothetical protein
MKDLLTRALEAHGGLSRWREIEPSSSRCPLAAGCGGSRGFRTACAT